MALMYCKRCGRIVQHYPERHPGVPSYCDCCRGVLHLVPKEYWISETLDLIPDDLEQQFINEYVLNSPEFDQTWFDKRDGILAEQNARYNERMAAQEAMLEKQRRVPRCPSCGSANVSKIGIISRTISVSLFGMASDKIGKTHKCNHCGTTW